MFDRRRPIHRTILLQREVKLEYSTKWARECVKRAKKYRGRIAINALKRDYNSNQLR
jgi:hypothetical protein